MTTTATNTARTSTAHAPAASVAEHQHIVLNDISWEFYERLLEEIGDRPIRVTFDEGSIEIMSPLIEHELPGRAFGALLRMLAVELNIPMSSFGSATFRMEKKQKGLEPDDCFYIANQARVRGIKEFDPEVHPPPDLAIEVDITRRSVARQPIYAALGVPELWRYDGKRLHVLKLTAAGTYEAATASLSFPFLPMADFERFLKRMLDEEQTKVLREFRDWVRTLQR